MIYLSIKGRLGNQMFQYAFARALKDKINQEIVIDWHDVLEAGFDKSLLHFNICSVKSADSIDYNSLMSLRQLYAYKKRELNYPYGESIEKRIDYESRFLMKHRNLGLLFFDNGYYDFSLFKMSNKIFMRGYFESEKYFKDIKRTIKSELTPKYCKLNNNLPLYHMIQIAESVCVTIRRGDFVNNPFHSVCTVDYFLKGMDYIAAKISNARFFIFSDDINWVKNNVKFKYPVVFESGNDPVWEKLRLMYSCKHFVISNSTFSWWAQYLCESKDKIVVVPNRWFNSTFKSDLLNNPNFITIR